MTTMPLLRKIEQLVELDPDTREAIAALPIETVPVQRRGDVLRLGERPDFLYCIQAGWAARYALRSDGSRRITGFMLPGDFCGVHAVGEAAMDHAVTALSACEVGRVPLAAVDAVAAAHPVVVEKALWRAKLADEAILRRWLLMTMDSFQSVGHLLCELHARADAAGLVEEGRVALPLTQADIADAVGITPVHTNRVIKRLRLEGLVQLADGYLVIEDLDALRRASRFDSRYLHPWDGMARPGRADPVPRTKWEQIA